MTTAHIDGGFTAPVFDAQSIFHSVMHAMAEPGTVHEIDAVAQPPAALGRVAAAVALTLCDHDTVIWLDPSLARHSSVHQWLSFHCGSRITTDTAEAQFAFVADALHLPALSDFAQGSQEYPDRSTTIILQVDSLDDGDISLQLRGPGILDVAEISPSPLPQGLVAQWRQNNALFPRGVDLILTAPDALACIARTTRIEIVED